ncbi:MAG TPA: hypothetical protein VEP90_27705 [Methylomirabilota bacterium]|nr:hypothetical protein [Methylomirabilota bacterium]
MSTNEALLRHWGFWDEYNKYRITLVDLAVGVYLTICDLLKSPPKQDDCVKNFEYTLDCSNLFQGMINRHPSMPPDLRKTMVQALVECTLDNNWPAINGHSCP